MRKTVATVFAGVASFILILCILFTSVWLVLNDDVFMENELKKTATATDMGMSIADQARALHKLTDYMQSKTEDINVDVTVNGELVPMYALEIEHTHMEEVQQVWTSLSTYRNLALVLVFVLFAVALLIAGKGFIVSWLRGYLFGLAFFTLIAAFIGTWAAANFDAFWVFFHNILFPSSSNWMLPAESRMIQMLPSNFFSDVIVRICLIGVGAVLALGAGSAIVLVVLRRKRGKEQIIEIEDEEIHDIIEPEGPNLIVEHKKLNMPVSKREQIEKENQ